MFNEEQKDDVALSLPMFRILFNELLLAGRDMSDRDRLGLYYLPEDEYFADLLKRYAADGNESRRLMIANRTGQNPPTND